MRAVPALMCLGLAAGQLFLGTVGQAASPLPGATKATPGAGADKALFDTDDPTIVKRSSAGVCHDRKSPSFEATVHFRGYRTLKDCLESGGRLPGK
jgi:hypothetical protein